MQKIGYCDAWILVVAVPLDLLLFSIDLRMVWKRTLTILQEVVVDGGAVDIVAVVDEDDEVMKRTWNADSDCQCPW